MCARTSPGRCLLTNPSSFLGQMASSSCSSPAGLAMANSLTSIKPDTAIAAGQGAAVVMDRPVLATAQVMQPRGIQLRPITLHQPTCLGRTTQTEIGLIHGKFSATTRVETRTSPAHTGQRQPRRALRRWSSGGGSRVFVATATDWREPATYQMHRYRTLENDKAPSKKRAAKGQTRIRNAELFPDLGPAGAEDQFLYMDSDGNYHAVFHNMVGTDTKDHWWLLATGGHAWSRDGWNWTYTGVAWGNATARSDLPNEQGAFVTYRDGSPAHFTRVERPHLIFAGAALRGDPEWLVSSIQYGGGMSPRRGLHERRRSFTLIQQVRRHKPMAAARVR